MHNYSSRLANPTVVSIPDEDKGKYYYDTTNRKSASATKLTIKKAPIRKEDVSTSMSHQLSESSKNILEASIRPSTRQKYKTYLNRWDNYCIKNKIDDTEITATNVVNFLSELFDTNVSYSVIKCAKSALSQKISLPPYVNVGDHPTIRKFMTGVFNLRPPRQKVSFVWDVKQLFDYFKLLDHNDKLTDKDLTHKLVLLLLLLGGQRVNTIFNFHVNEMIT